MADVAGGLHEAGIVFAADNEGAALDAEGVERGCHFGGPGLAVGDGGHDDEAAAGSVVAEGGADGEPAHLPGEGLAVAVRPGAEGDAAADADGGAVRALAGGAHALLPADLGVEPRTSPRLLVLCVPVWAFARWAT